MSKEKLLNSLRSKGFSNKIVNAFSEVDRKEFVEGELKNFAYRDRPLPIGENATISQPFTIAFMLDLLELDDSLKVLEIGSGCGYVLALLDEIIKESELYGVELNSDLVKKAKKYLSGKKIKVINKNGYKGLKEYSPFDRILVSAAYPEEPTHLFSQLKKDGIIVSPVKHSIIKYKKVDDEIVKESHYGFSFVPMR